ncbi:hypothetical protein A3A39_00715 [Candidatus Kaiserbacteria bacterium RIFCSPLOWO2_01_FULL_54_13]|uniref:Homoserine dehydrogenase n=1 Tax=Candidatus Kaiserbacteria bacterium RIFCSPLOWO2_01_FULL_54_13 TaxID=1798512 RepID=A0A1F6EZV1_9BACT|nr:MAG: hypothetical protein A3A39_00715 [Candidatus Kaiserbacteria bacterium RIFCSPLOWO2_01_FULL_54_13]
MYQNVFIIGATGKVGSTLVHQIYEKGDTSRSIHVNPTRIVGLASSSSVAFSKKGIGKKEALKFLKTKNGISYNRLDELIALARTNRDHLVFVDVTALKEPMIEFHKKVISKTPFSIVTANKNPIAYADFNTFTFLTKEPDRYGYRCSVMAGADAVPFLRDLRDVRDKPTLIEGCFSGTLGYITSMLERNKRFSDILDTAWRRGYTEPDPRDDLSGFDVARKLVVLARSAGVPVGLKEVHVQPFIPRSYFKKESVGKFIRSTKGLDHHFAQEIKSAKKNGSVLRYVATMRMKGNTPCLSVRLQKVVTNSQLVALQGTLNKILVVSKIYGKENPYSVQGPGAGLDVTAQNIRRDLLYLLERRVITQ